MKGYVVNTAGNNVKVAQEAGFKAYYSPDFSVTAIELKAENKTQARQMVRKLGLYILYVFE